MIVKTRGSSFSDVPKPQVRLPHKTLPPSTGTVLRKSLSPPVLKGRRGDRFSTAPWVLKQEQDTEAPLRLSHSFQSAGTNQAFTSLHPHCAAEMKWYSVVQA